MAGTFAPKTLADGFVPNISAAIYTSPALTATYIKALNVKNTNVATQTVQVSLRQSGGSARPWKQAVLDTNEFAEFLTDGETLELEAGDTIEAVTTTASAAPYFITGVQET